MSNRPCGEGTEAVVRAAWASLLGTEVIGEGDNFFELGGHSLLAVQLMALLRDQLDFGDRLGLLAIFTSPDFGDFVRAVEAVLAQPRDAD